MREERVVSSPDDEALARRDRALPGLATLLDANAMREALARHGIEFPALVPTYVRYKPQTSCLVGYRTQPGDGIVGLHATTFGVDFDDKLDKALMRAARDAPDASVRTARPFVHLARERSVVAVFPFDPDVPALSRLGDRARRDALLARVFKRDSAPPTGPVEPLAYKPGRRFVGRVVRSDGSAAVVRLYSSDRPARSLRPPPALVDGERLRVAPRIGGSKRHHAAAVGWLKGETLRDLVRDRRSADSIGSIGQALAELHRADCANAEGMTRRRIQDGLCEAERELVWLLPDASDRVVALRARIEGRLASIPTVERLVHGDLYDKQIVVSSDGVGLVDLDDLGIGDPRSDLALMLSHWERDRLLGVLEDGDRDLDRRLCEAYARAADVSLSEFEAFVAAGLFRIAQGPFRSRSRYWRREIDSILERIAVLAET